ncbi:MAG TPA: class E sortase, partial [Ilumatobacteraceae bacterium]
DDAASSVASPDLTATIDIPPVVPEAAPESSRRLRKWERQHPHDWRYFVGMAGRLLIATGLLLFGFVAYQLWGTGIETARAQRKLENEFEAMLAEAPTTTEAPAPTTTTPPPTSEPATSQPPTTASPVTTPPVTEPPAVDQQLPAFTSGDAIARLEMPTIGVDDIVVAGVSVEALRKGPGHFPDTPMPGQLGNSAIAGHRTTYGQPFRNIDDLEPGDEIVVTTLAGRFVYTVTGTQIVNPGDYWVVATTDPSVATLTLTSCHPVWEASQRIVVSAELDSSQSAPVGNPTFYAADTPEALPGDETASSTPTVTEPDATTDSTPSNAEGPITTEPAPGDAGADDEPAPPALSGATEDAFAHGWFDDDGAFLHVALWGMLLILISVGSYLVSRRFKRDLVGFAIGVIPFVVALYFFFQNVNRLLPPNL